MKINKVFLQIIVLVPIFFAIGFVFKSNSKALSWDQPYYDVNIDINQDSTFSVNEKAKFSFTGDLNGMRRDITLFDADKSQFCTTSGSFLCGGFEFLTFQDLEVDGKVQQEKDYKLYEVTEDSGSRYFRIEKRLHDPEKYVVKETHDWDFNYKVYGGIQWLKNKDQVRVPYFYWNLLPENRGAITESSIIKIKMPSSVSIDTRKLTIYDYNDTQYTIDIDRKTNSIVLEFTNLPSYSYLTASYEFGENELTEPGTINLNYIAPTLGGSKTFFDGYEIYANQNNQFEYFPAGENTFEFKRTGYNTQNVTFELSSGGTKNIDIDLQPKFWMVILLLLSRVSLILGIIFIPILLFIVYLRYESKGRDINMPKTIVPKFKNPEGMPPYLVGALVDEKVDQRDITGTIIDLAYRGFYKIKEIKKGKNYELIKQDKSEDSLDLREKELMGIFFSGAKKSFKTTSITLTVATKLKQLKTEIDKDLKEKGYFERSPNLTRSIYLGTGIAMLVLGGISTFGITLLLVTLTGELALFTFGIALIGMGISTMFIAKYMPAKTELGSKKYAEILGFKMYLTTAERFRLKDLTPEEFEKYLSYAVALGVEKEWAKSFKDIYKDQPDWYEGSNLNDALLVSSFSRSFSNATTSQIRSVTASSSSSGGGWSGGGGGFSGGGGGGGSSGGW